MVCGLAAWRMGDCETAADGFDRAAATAINPELSAAAYYWASRSYIRCRQPEQAAEKLRGAAMMDETLYGMLAREQLGQQLPRAGQTPDLSPADWQQIGREENVRIAVALAELGHDELADEVLRHQARIGDPSQFTALSRLARELGLPSTQLWMAHNAPRGGRPDPALRFPVARWAPVTGWQVDPALAYAHALQESNFRAKVVSPAGARGLMQIMPATAKNLARGTRIKVSKSVLKDPQVSIELGSKYLAKLKRRNPALPCASTAYNAGGGAMKKWRKKFGKLPIDEFVETMPYNEARRYAKKVLSTMAVYRWLYEGKNTRLALDAPGVP